MSRHRRPTEPSRTVRLTRLIAAARAARHDAEGRDTRAVADAVEDLGSLAAWAIPVHGVFVPNNHDICAAIDAAATAHLGLRPAQRELLRCLNTVASFDQRDAIEVAHARVSHVSAEAYFYAGLAFGVTLGHES